MKSHPYARFINWTAATYIEERQPGTGQSQAVLTWLRAYGITAARVDAFLRLSGQHSATMPNALVMDILELSNSKVRQTLKDEYLLDALLHTWSALADVYGRAATPADREVARLLLLGEAGHALIMAQGMGYPGAETLLRRYWMETELLDLSQIHKGTAGFKDVGSDLRVHQAAEKGASTAANSCAGPAAATTYKADFSAQEDFQPLRQTSAQAPHACPGPGSTPASADQRSALA
jgi:hypothetical protein